MADNSLTIQIGADSSKLRAELALTEARLKTLGSQLKAAAKSGDEGEVRRLAAEYEAAREQFSKYRDELKAPVPLGAKEPLAELHTAVGQLRAPFAAFHQAAAGAYAPLARLREGFSEFREPLSELHEGFSRIGESISGMVERTMPRLREVLGLSLGAAAYEVTRTAGEAASGVRDTENYAKAFGLDTGSYEALELTFAKAGLGGDRAVQVLTRFAQAIGQARQSMEKANGMTTTFAHGVALLRGSVGATASDVETLRGGVVNVGASMQAGVQVLRGAVHQLPDLSSPFGTLKSAMGINLERYSQDAAGQIRLLSDFADRFNRLNASQQAVVGQQFFGREWSQAVAALRNLGPEMRHARELIEASGLGLEGVEKRQAAVFNASEALFSFYIERIKQIIGNGIGQAFIPFFDGITRQLAVHGEQIRAWAAEMGRNLANVSRDLVRLFSGEAAQTPFGKDIATAAQTVVSTINALRAAWEGLRPILDGVANSVNAIFGTHFTAASLAAVAAIGMMSGAFSLLAALVSPGGLVVVGVIAFLAALGKLPEWIVDATEAFRAWGSYLGGPFGSALKAIGDDFAVLSDLLHGKFAAALNDWKSFFVDAVTSVRQAFTALVADIGAGIQKVIGWVQSAAGEMQSFGSSLAALFSGGGGSGGSGSGVVASAAIPPAAGHAAGGLISGPGSGTSDSILARVSNGEYVMRAAAVARIGVGTLDRLNHGFADGGLVNTVPRFALGGLVELGRIADRIGAYALGGLVAVPDLSTPMPSFAGGGLVAAGAGGSHVHLTLDGQTYHLHADDRTAASLERAARQRQMTSAGRKPGWYGS